MKKRMVIRRLLRLCSIYCLLFTIHCCYVFASSWPTFKNDSARTSHKFSQAYPPLSEKWSYNVFSPIRCSPVIKNEIVYVGTSNGAVYAFNENTGDVIWQESTDGKIISSPLVSDGVCYVASQNGNLYAFDASSGTILWKYHSCGKAVSSPLEIGNLIVWGAGYGSDDVKNCLIAVDKSGNFRWKFDTGQIVHSSPATDGKFIYFASNNGKIYKLGFTGSSATEEWSFSTKGSFSMATPAVDNGIIYFAPGGDERWVYALDVLDKSKVWTDEHTGELNTEGEGVFASSIATDEDKIYVTLDSVNHWLYAINKSDGSLVWSKNLGSGSESGYVSSPVVADDVVYIGSSQGTLYGISSSTGGILEEYLVNSSSPEISSIPAISDGLIFVGGSDGYFRCFEASKIASISSPDNGDTVSGSVSIIGKTVNPDFKDYKIEYSTSAAGQWIFVSSSAISVNGGVLGVWNAYDVVKGTYYLKLTVEENSPSGTENTAVNYVFLDNPPPPPTNVAAFDTPLDEGGQITLTWTKSTDDDGGDNDVNEYRIYRRLSTGTYSYSSFVSLPAGSTYYIDSSGIADNTTYFYVIRAIAENAESGDSSEVNAFSRDNLAPQTPTGLTILNPGTGGRLELSWVANSEKDLTYYRIYRSTDDVSYGLLVQLSSGIISYSDVSVTDFVTYFYKISAVDDASNESTLSGSVSAYSWNFPPSAPSGFSALPGDGFINLTWLANAESDMSFYRIYRATDNISFVFLADILHPGTTHQDSGLTNGTTYYYHIVAFDVALNRSTASFASAFPYPGADSTKPCTITNLRAGEGSRDGEVVLAWMAPGDDGTIGQADHYEIFYTTDSNFDWIFFQNANLWKSNRPAGGASGFREQETVTGLDIGKEYYFRLRAVDNAGNWSELSNSATSYAVSVPPAKITDLVAHSTEEGKVFLNWTSPGDDGSSGTLSGGFKIQDSTHSDFSVFSEMDISTVTSAGERQNLCLDLLPFVTYFIRICAYDDVGLESDFSAVSTITVLGIAPAKITNFSAFTPPGTQSEIKIVWKATGDDGTVGNILNGKFEIKYSSDSDLASYYLIALSTSVSAGETQTCLITNLKRNTSYYFTVRMADEWGIWSEVSDVISGWSANIPPAAAQNLTALHTIGSSPGSGGRVFLSWTPSSDDGAGFGDVSSYFVYRSTCSGVFNGKLGVLSAGATTYSDTTLSDGIRYYYAVRAFDGIDFSDFSNEVEVTGKSEWKRVSVSSGGIIATVDRVEVVIEQGTFPDDDYIKISKLAPGEFSNEGLPSNVKPLNEAWEFSLYSTTGTFSKLVTIKLPYSASEVADMSEAHLRIYFWNEAKGEWSIVNTSEPHPEESRVWARVSHFSVYRIMEFLPTTLLEKSSVYAWPNPAVRTDKVYFKFKTGNDCDVFVDVYNTAGEWIAHLEKAGNSAGIVSQIEWNISDIASGVYIFRLRAKSANGDMEVVKKVAIIK